MVFTNNNSTEAVAYQQPLPNGISHNKTKPKVITSRNGHDQEDARENEEILNLYQPETIPQTLHANTPPKLYDINFVFPFHILETDHVRLEPFVPSKHLSGFLKLPAESWTHFGELGPYTQQTALEDIESFRIDPRCLLLAVIDKQVEKLGRDGFAGVYGLIEMNDEFMHAIFGLINILPIYHCTHINTHAMSLILRYLFEDLSLIRVQYDAVTHNTPSINSAKKFGFREEGICRNFNGLVPLHKKVGDPKERKSRSQDMWVASMTDWDWFNGVKGEMEGKVRRTVVDTTLLMSDMAEKADGHGHSKHH
ncbi:hypothetical protein I302_103727 [Kwoniella bestiolae CBS 10118]|uniref:N-acetyltransferase domain-containing protein n=1 Tax=Kwoniella bestiolae CBS 10118 TaxID=1296100 RepID=A0A1B9G9A3_9TREE|nr:hypothetical protein I302_02430 [Kwoniella bestiolae CBS 10118]OCF27587.1 hypothetical protein I302_02430 [Kwoniella bestiolae CBS 10118]